MPEASLPLPVLENVDNVSASDNKRRWMRVAIGTLVVWLGIVGGLVVTGMSGVLSKAPQWLNIVLVLALLAASVLPFPALLVGMFDFRFRHGKVTAYVSGLNVLFVIVFFGLLVYTSLHPEK